MPRFRSARFCPYAYGFGSKNALRSAAKKQGQHIVG